ncbi:MAG TPA: helix-turn-helix domain-containing protein [Gammaproteobacteria bacterium]|nr:helix-turn-helix domain-containing protein [Gammaproteobacteria bacterium]
MNSDGFYLTHEFLSEMLSVRRAIITIVVGALQTAGLITYQRGPSTIMDSQRLKDVSCGCYQIIKQEYDRLIG